MQPASSQTLTFLFTDIEGSTRLWEEHRQAMQEALERHDAILRATVERADGQVVKNIGDGFMAVFGSAADGVCAALYAQHALAKEAWGETGPLRVRMGLHVGEAAAREGDYYGPTLNRTARIMGAGHGGQVLLSAAAAALAADDLPEGSSLRDLGEHPLKGLGRPERVFQLEHPDLASSFPPLVTPARRPAPQLPEQPSAFVGREAELREIAARVADDSVRLLTLTGPGGIGKTRLSLRSAAGAADGFEDGVFFVDLSNAADTESALGAIAEALDVVETGEQPLLAEIKQRLEGQHVLLVLDNFEQVNVAAPAVAELVQSCPRLKLLVTSREALHVAGEHLFAVPPLSLPSAAARTASAEELARYEAVQLFVARAQAVKPGFRLTDENVAAVAEITRRLDGLPLALELATARLNLFTPEALRDRLGSSLHLLRSGPRDAPARQQTLRDTIEWSYQLLERGEQRLFELLSTFSGATFDAVEAVAGNLNGSAPGIDTLDGVASLIDKSLVRQADTVDGEPRLEMLETIREYAAERLDAEPEFGGAARRAHARYFAELAAARRAGAGDLENLRLAWRHWVSERELEQLIKLLDNLWSLYEARGAYEAMIELLAEQLDVLGSAPPTSDRAMQELTLRTSLARATMVARGYTDEVEDAYARALEPFAGEQVPQLYPVLRGLASFYNYLGRFDRGIEMGHEILRLADVEDDTSMRIDGLQTVGTSMAFAYDLRAGLDELDKAVALIESHGYPPPRLRLGANSAVVTLNASGLLHWLAGFPDRALGRANQAVARATELEHPFSLAYALHHTAYLHLWRREPELVRDRAVGVLDVSDEYDLQVWSAIGSILLGAAKTGLGRGEEGMRELGEGINRYAGLRTPPVFWPLLLYLRAEACARVGTPREGLRIVDDAIAIAGHGGVLRPLLFVLKGELLHACGDDADTCLRQAFDFAAGFGALMLQLRAAVCLCRADAEGARDLLSATYAEFTEGFETPDLLAARELLGATPPPRGGR